MSRTDRRRGRPELEAVRRFAVECPGCGTHLAVDRESAGLAVACPACAAGFLVPVADRAEPPRSEEPAATSAPSAPATPAVPQEPLVFSEPPLPSTRRSRIEPSPVAASAVVESRAADVPAWAEGPTIAVAEPAADVPADAMVFREPVKTIRSGGTVIEIRRLSPEELRGRRARRNLIILVLGAAILVALVVVLAKRGG